MTGETFFQLHYHLTDTERLFDLAQGIAARRRRLKKHDARCRRFSWYARGLLRRGIAFLILAAVLGAMTVLLKLGGVSGAMAGLCFGCGVTELVLRGQLQRSYRRSWQQFRQQNGPDGTVMEGMGYDYTSTPEPDEDDDEDVPPPVQENAPEPLPGGMVVKGFFADRVTIQRLDPAGVAESGIVPVLGSVKAGSAGDGLVQRLDLSGVTESGTDPMVGSVKAPDAGEILTSRGAVLIESAAPRSTVTTDIPSLREDGVEDIFFRYQDTMTHYSVDKMADAAGEDADVELKQNREDISLRLDGETRDDLSERYQEWVPVWIPEVKERLILTHEGVEQKTSEELRREREEAIRELDESLRQERIFLIERWADHPSLDEKFSPWGAETPGIGLDESLKQLAARFEDIAPEEDKKPLLFPVKPTVTERKKYTYPLESDLRSYADLGDDLPNMQGEIKLWIPEDLEKAKEISISKESLSRSDGIA